MRARVLVIGVVVALLTIGGWLWWTAGPGASPPMMTTTSLPPVPPLPDAPPSAPTLDPAPAQPSESLDTPAPITAGVIDSGTLVIEARGQRLGTEEYTLERREDGGLVLRSQGKLRFKIALFTVEATFLQAMTFTEHLRPISYQIALDGPIGIGSRRVSASFGTTTGTVNDGERQTEIALPEEPFLLLGMFSSYAILPLWAAPDTPQRLRVISMRGDRREQREIWVLLEHVGPMRLRDAQGNSLEAQEYRLKGDRATLKLYLAGERLVGLQNDSPRSDESFRLYRGDLFPQGFTVLSTQN